MGGGGGGMPGGMPGMSGGGGGGGGICIGANPMPGGGAIPGGSTGIGGGGGGMPIGMPIGMAMGIAWGPVANRVCGCLLSLRALAASSRSASVPCLSPRESFLYAYLRQAEIVRHSKRAAGAGQSGRT